MSLAVPAVTPPQTNIDRFVAWSYGRFYDPASTNADLPADVYRWSLESTTDLRTGVWIVVTNYPKGYAGDDWVTNSSVFKWYRRHGKL